MIDSKLFYDFLIENNIRFFTGVPDSLLKDFCACIVDHSLKGEHIPAANEGGAVAIACGHYLSTGKVALVYMQNSGIGNAINPLISLADASMYSIPLVLLIGWRGEPGKEDELEHRKQGHVTLPFLDMLDIPYKILSREKENMYESLNWAFRILKDMSRPVAIVIRKNTFSSYQPDENSSNLIELTREEVVRKVASNLGKLDIIVSTTGKTSRELYEYREELDRDHSKDFLVIGSMGHASQIALGLALAKPKRQIYCLDGDGAAIMHMGSFAVIGSQKPANFKHIVINNGAYDSTGGQLSAGFSISFPGIAKSCGYLSSICVDNSLDLVREIQTLKNTKGPALLEIKVRKGARDNLGRPTSSLKKSRINFMEFVSK